MIQKLKTDEWETMMHSIVHEKKEEHNHVLGESRYIFLDVEFDEEVAKGFLPLYGDHEYRLEAYIPVVVDGKPVADFEKYSDGSISDGARAYIKKQTWDFRKIAVEKMKKENSFRVNITDEIRKARADRDAVTNEALDYALSEKCIECSDFKEAYRIRKEKEAVEKAEKEAAEAITKAEQAIKDAEVEEKLRADRLEWAKKHGSDRLLKGFQHGHRCVKLYESELGEYLIQDSDYLYDRDNNVETKNRSCPSLKALEEVERIEKIEGLSAAAVWLPEGTWALYKDESCEPDSGCEAVSIDVKNTRGYWYKTF